MPHFTVTSKARVNNPKNKVWHGKEGTVLKLHEDTGTVEAELQMDAGGPFSKIFVAVKHLQPVTPK